MVYIFNLISLSKQDASKRKLSVELKKSVFGCFSKSQEGNQWDG